MADHFLLQLTLTTLVTNLESMIVPEHIQRFISVQIQTVQRILWYNFKKQIML